MELKKRGLNEDTIKGYVERLERLSRLCNLNDPEQVRETLSNLPWKNTTKSDVAQKYTTYLKFKGGIWQQPTYKRDATVPYIPTEKELDELINAGSYRTATTLQALKETGTRIGEIMKLKWQDIDEERRLIYIRAEKGSNDRYLPISQKLLGMLKRMPKINDNVFQPTKHGFRVTFESLRKRTAQKLQNPRLLQIHLHTFRHWFATTKMHEYRDAWAVKELLGHKTVVSTEVYIHIEKQLYTQMNAGFICKITTTIEERMALIEQGFEKHDEKDGIAIYRKRK